MPDPLTTDLDTYVTLRKLDGVNGNKAYAEWTAWHGTEEDYGY